MHYYHRGPSRLIWFIIGAASATWWIKSKEAHGFQVRHCSRARIPQEAYSAPVSQDQQQPGQSQGQQGQTQTQTQGNPWHHRRWEWTWPTPPPTGAGIASAAGSGGAANNVGPTGEPRTPLPMPQSADNWDEERQRLQKLATQASETLADLSEAGLDSLLSTAEMLKARIAERRAQREREIREAQESAAVREEKFKQFEEWQRQQVEAAQQQKPKERLV